MVVGLSCESYHVSWHCHSSAHEIFSIGTVLMPKVGIKLELPRERTSLVYPRPAVAFLSLMKRGSFSCRRQERARPQAQARGTSLWPNRAHRPHLRRGDHPGAVLAPVRVKPLFLAIAAAIGHLRAREHLSLWCYGRSLCMRRRPRVSSPHAQHRVLSDMHSVLMVPLVRGDSKAVCSSLFFAFFSSDVPCSIRTSRGRIIIVKPE